MARNDIIHHHVRQFSVYHITFHRDTVIHISYKYSI